MTSLCSNAQAETAVGTGYFSHSGNGAIVQKCWPIKWRTTCAWESPFGKVPDFQCTTWYTTPKFFLTPHMSHVPKDETWTTRNISSGLWKFRFHPLLQSECSSCLLRTSSFSFFPSRHLFFCVFFCKGQVAAYCDILGNAKANAFWCSLRSPGKGSDLFWEHNYMNFCFLVILAWSTLQNTQQNITISKKAKTTSIRNTVRPTERKVKVLEKYKGTVPTYCFIIFDFLR